MSEKSSTGRWDKGSDEQGGWKNAELRPRSMCPKSNESPRISRSVFIKFLF